MRLLEAPNGTFRGRTVDAIDRAGRVGPIAQRALELPDVRRAAVNGITRTTSNDGRLTPIRSTSRKARPWQAQQKRRGQCACRRHTGRS
jgi:hypothetical protein